LQPIAGSPNYEKGLQFEKQQLWPQAIASYEQALRDDPSSMATYERLSLVYVNNGRYQDAIALLTTASQKFPDNASLLARRSRARSALAASDDLPLSLTSSGPSSGPPPQTVAFEPEEESGKKRKKSKKSEDEEEVESDVKEEKSGKSGKKSGGKSSKKSKSKEDPETGARTIKVGEEADASQPGSAQSGGNDASLIAEAIRDAELAIQKNGDLADAHLALGFACLAEANSIDRALAAFVRASTIAPEEAEAYFGVGSVYRLKQQYQQAVPQLKKAIELRPDYYEAQRELAYCYHTMGNTDQAIRQYEVASSYRGKTKDSGDLAANNLALATLYKKKGDEVGGAKGEEYKKASKAYEDDAKEEEPNLKKATKRLAVAGVVKFIEIHLSPDTRKIWDNNKNEKESRPLRGSKLPLNIPVPRKDKEPINIKLPIGGKKSQDEKAPKESKSPINIKLPTGGKSSKDAKDAKDTKSSKDTKPSKNTRSPINDRIPPGGKSSKDSKAPTDSQESKDAKPTSRATPKVKVPLKKPFQ
jgi:tetratricopeptide (TPR) repeat protein